MGLYKKKLEDLKAQIQKTATVLKAVPEPVFYIKNPRGKWSIIQILGHLVDSAANNHQRITRALCSDNPSYSNYNQDDWVRVQSYNKANFFMLVQFWESYNYFLLSLFSTIGEKSARKKIDFVEGNVLSIMDILENYIEHILHHTEQVKRKSSAFNKK